MKKNLALLVATVSAALLVIGCSKTEAPVAQPQSAPAQTVQTALDLDSEKVLNLYNWPDYIPPSLLESFTQTTGIKVNYDTYENNETMHTKLVAGKTGYDLVVTGNVYAKQELDAGLMQALDKRQLSNLSNLDTQLMAKLAQVDTGNQHLVPWAWGFTTVGINRGKVSKALGSMPFPDNAWDLVFNPLYTAKLKSCGIAYQDSFADVIPLALHYLGKNPGSSDAQDIKAVSALLAKVRKDVGLFSVGMIDDMASGKACVAIGYSSEIN